MTEPPAPRPPAKVCATCSHFVLIQDYTDPDFVDPFGPIGECARFPQHVEISDPTGYWCGEWKTTARWSSYQGRA